MTKPCKTSIEFQNRLVVDLKLLSFRGCYDKEGSKILSRQTLFSSLKIHNVFFFCCRFLDKRFIISTMGTKTRWWFHPTFLGEIIPFGEAVRSGGSPPPRRGADASQRAKWKPQSFVWGGIQLEDSHGNYYIYCIIFFHGQSR